MAHEIYKKEVFTDEDAALNQYGTYTNPIAQIVWFLLGVINTLLGLRLILRAVGANPAAGFTDFIYTITAPLVDPFVNVIRSARVDTGIIEWYTIVAMIIYSLIAWAIVRLATMARPLARH